MKLEKEIENIIDETIEKLNVSKEEYIKQIINLKKSIINEVDHFDLDKEYYDIYSSFRESVDSKYLCVFTDILDVTVRIIINDIYLNFDSLEQINIETNVIEKLSATKRRHFSVAKNIAECTIKKYYFNPKSNKRILEYIDELLPENYVKDKDIDFVVWYFLVCIVILYKKI